MAGPNGLDCLKVSPAASPLHPVKHRIELVVPFRRHGRGALLKDEKDLLATGLLGIGFGPMEARAFWIDAHQIGLRFPKLEIPRVASVVSLEVGQP